MANPDPGQRPTGGITRYCHRCGLGLFNHELGTLCLPCDDYIDNLRYREPVGFRDFWHEVNMNSFDVIPVD